MEKRTDKLPESDFKVFFELSSDLFCVLDYDFNITSINPAVKKVFGYTIDEIAGRPVVNFLHPDDRKKVLDALNNAARQGLTLQQLEARGSTKSGLSVWTEWTCNPLPEARSVYCIGRDITVTKNVQEALKASEFLLRESQEIAKLGYYELNVSLGNWKSSEILDGIFGIPRDYARTVEAWLDIVHPDDREMMQDYFVEHVLEGHHPFDKEYRVRRIADGQEKWVYGLGKVEYDAQGKPVAMIGTIQDITERKIVEIELKNKYEELEKHNKLMLGREKRVLELKKEVDDLLKSVGKPPKYGV